MLTKSERAALLKCRYAGRYDTLLDPKRKRATREEAAEEQAASFVTVSVKTFARLTERGLITPAPRSRLTDAGRAALETSK